jgi:hypothetical protein
MSKIHNRATLQARNTAYGMDIILNISGREHYLTSRRRNGLLWLMLKDGKTLGELARIKPTSRRIAQKQYHYANRLIKTAKDYFNYELKMPVQARVPHHRCRSA